MGHDTEDNIPLLSGPKRKWEGKRACRGKMGGWRGSKKGSWRIRQWERKERKRERAPSSALRDTGYGPISMFKISPLRHCPQQCWLTTVPDPRAFLFLLREKARRLVAAQRESDSQNDSCTLICLYIFALFSFLIWLLSSLLCTCNCISLPFFNPSLLLHYTESSPSSLSGYIRL